MFGRRPFYVWMKLETKSHVSLEPPLQDHLGDPQITLYKASFLFLRKLLTVTAYFWCPHLSGT